MDSFEPAMRLALELAASTDTGSAVGSDVPVGAVVLDASGSVLGQGRNQCLAATDPTAHAEIVAIRHAAAAARSWRLDGCTLVVTLEPCTMCAGAVLTSRIRRLVYGAIDPRAGAAGSLWDVVRDRRLGPPVEVLGGILAAESAALLSGFFERRRAE
jgi:tRNA(adenine34) deaminase